MRVTTVRIQCAFRVISNCICCLNSSQQRVFIGHSSTLNVSFETFANISYQLLHPVYEIGHVCFMVICLILRKEYKWSILGVALVANGRMHSIHPGSDWKFKKHMEIQTIFLSQLLLLVLIYDHLPYKHAWHECALWEENRSVLVMVKQTEHYTLAMKLQA